MNINNNSTALLVLNDGTVYRGKAIGKIGTTLGEICFNTGMTGYQETFTDPSYFGQILIETTSHVGNYGVQDDEVESDRINIAGLVCKKFSKTFSRPSGKSNIQDYFVENGIVGISDCDTRAIVRHIREKGAMNAIISSEIMDVEELKKRLKSAPSMDGLELSSKVATKTAYTMGNPDAKYRVSVLDLGVKRNILKCLVERDCYLKVFPYNATMDEILSWNPNGIMLSNGPGDPSVMKDVIEVVKKLTQTGVPMFGICLGHQILALSLGLKTYKMHNGHRGLNHPIKNLVSGKGEITSQNHGFVVDKEGVLNHPDVEMTHEHLNDGSLAGLKMKTKPVFSVQYHPEASAGPHDSRYLFDQFIELIKSNVKQTVKA